MSTVHATGAQTCVIGTEHTVATITAAGGSIAKHANFITNLRLLEAGDTIELRVKGKAGSTDDTESLIRYAVFTGPIAEPRVDSEPLDVTYGATFTIKQTTGTGRSVRWHVNVLD